jgi:hypothetical protein
VAKPNSKKPADASPEQPAPAKKGVEKGAEKSAPSPLLAQVNALLARGDNLAAKALLAQNPGPAVEDPALAAVSARLRFDPGAIAAAGGVLAAILFALVAAILLRK